MDQAILSDSPFVRPLELADRWSLNHKTVLRAIQEHEIPSTRVGRRLLIPRAWVEAREAGGAVD